MPLIVVYNLSKIDYTEERIAMIEETNTASVCAITELGLTDEKISFSFPQDPTVTSEDVPVKIIVEMFYDRPEIMPELRKLFAKTIADTLREVVTSWRKLKSVSVAVPRFDPIRDGYASA